MKFKHIRLILIAACLLLTAGGLAACRQDVLTLEDIREMGYDCTVIFDLAGGTSGSGDRARSELHQYVKSGSPIVKPGTEGQTFSGEVPVRAGYTLGGYYRGTKAEDGTVTYDMTEKWDFSKDKVTEDLTLYAYWRQNYEIVIHYDYDAAEASSADHGFRKTHSVTVQQTEEGVALSTASPAIPGYTAVGYYEDYATAAAAESDKADKSGKLEFPLTPTDRFSETSLSWEIWAYAVEGDFVVVRKASDFSLFAGTNLYLLSDVDLAQEDGSKKEVSFPDTYIGKIYGNGHSISGFKVERTSARTDDYLGLFKRLSATAVIEGVTFENFELEVTTRGTTFRYHIGALAGRANEGATVKNVTLSGTVYYTLAEDKEEGEYQNTEFSASIAERESGVIEEGCDWSGVTFVDRKETP